LYGFCKEKSRNAAQEVKEGRERKKAPLKRVPEKGEKKRERRGGKRKRGRKKCKKCKKGLTVEGRYDNITKLSRGAEGTEKGAKSFRKKFLTNR
jgi:hypothetical protein